MNPWEAFKAIQDGLTSEDILKYSLLEAALLQVCAQWGIIVNYSVAQHDIRCKPIPGRMVYGVSFSGYIEIAEELNDDLPGRVLVLAHEVAHEFLHPDENRIEFLREKAIIEMDVRIFRQSTDIIHWAFEDCKLGDLVEDNLGAAATLPIEPIIHKAFSKLRAKYDSLEEYKRNVHEREEVKAEMVPFGLYKRLGLDYTTTRQRLSTPEWHGAESASLEALDVITTILDKYRVLENSL
jgi:hypothetical protein